MPLRILHLIVAFVCFWNMKERNLFADPVEPHDHYAAAGTCRARFAGSVLNVIDHATHKIPHPASLFTSECVAPNRITWEVQEDCFHFGILRWCYASATLVAAHTQYLTDCTDST